MTKIWNTTANDKKNGGEDVKQQDLWLLVGMQNAEPTLEDILTVCYTTKHTPTIHSNNALLDIYSN